MFNLVQNVITQVDVSVTFLPARLVGSFNPKSRPFFFIDHYHDMAHHPSCRDRLVRDGSSFPPSAFSSPLSPLHFVCLLSLSLSFFVFFAPLLFGIP
jgi:hypothetical protein